MRFFGRSQHTPAPAAPTEGLLAGHHVLVVDDDEELRRVVRVALEMEGARVSEADGVRRAVDLAERLPCDAVLTDITMGPTRRDGVRLLHRFRAAPALAKVPVIAMTGCKALRPELGERGFDLVVIKPFDVFDLPAAIRGLLRGAPPAAAAA
jgi:DNA-binding response OmpR family regulator